jgi:hypothetical protein
MEIKGLGSNNMMFFMWYNKKNGISFRYYINVLSSKTSYGWEINKILFK